MKKLFLLVAFAGIVGSSSALSISSLTKGTLITIGGEEKKDEKKKKCDKDKACCKKGGSTEGKACSGAKTEGKKCSDGTPCKSKGTASAGTEKK